MQCCFEAVWLVAGTVVVVGVAAFPGWIPFPMSLRILTSLTADMSIATVESNIRTGCFLLKWPEPRKGFQRTLFTRTKHSMRIF